MDPINMYLTLQQDEYIELATKHYYTRFGTSFSRVNVQRVVEECITTPLIESKSMNKWIELISTALSQVRSQCVKQEG